MTIKGVDDVSKLLEMLNFQVRSIYATANKYNSLNSVEGFSNPSNIARCTPTWDIDSLLPNWRETLAVAKHIVAFLEGEGVQNSVYLKWSGNGCHIHIHEEAISETALSKAHPLDLAYALVEYVNINVLREIDEKLNVKGLNVENRMDVGRVFTCPLSLHRNLDVICICLKPNEIDSFSLEWIQPESFRHNTHWRDFVSGEADKLALKAYETVGGYSMLKAGKKRATKRLNQQINKWLQKAWQI
ncbi:MAG: hypothetical protein QW717_06225 [Candidatus Bathyarchaeia archaeon]